jgi:hypothetical protein
MLFVVSVLDSCLARMHSAGCRTSHIPKVCWQPCTARRTSALSRPPPCNGNSNSIVHARCRHDAGVQVLAADKQKHTMRVGTGMRYTEFLKEAQKAGMSVKVSKGCWADAAGAAAPANCSSAAWCGGSGIAGSSCS